MLGGGACGQVVVGRSRGTVSKCRVCRGPAVIDLPRHNANFCAEHLQQLCRRQVEKAIDDFDMVRPRRPRPRGRERGQGLARRVGSPARARLSGRRAVHRTRHRRVQRREWAPRSFVCRRARAAAARDRSARRVRLRHPDRIAGDAAGAVLVVRSVEAAPLRQGRSRRRI